MKKIIVTGGVGFLGSHLCGSLINQGHSVICLENLYSDFHKNISHLKEYPSFKFIKHDVSVPFKTPDPIDEIYNLACPASPIFYQKDPVHTTRSSVIGAINMLDLATEKNAKIVFCPLPQVDPTQRQPDISLAKQCLDWNPLIEIEEGITQTIKYFNNRLAL
jgi:UDP-glucuronate decarboxylase